MEPKNIELSGCMLMNVTNLFQFALRAIFVGSGFSDLCIVIFRFK